MQEKEADREARLREVASKLFFTLKNQGLRFSLYRDVDVPEPIRHDGLCRPTALRHSAISSLRCISESRSLSKATTTKRQLRLLTSYRMSS